ncbi:hydrogenase maturation protease [Streptomyces sp. 7R007]
MAVSTRIAVIAVGDRFRHDDGIGDAVLTRLRERAAVRPLPDGTTLARCEGEPGRLAVLWEDADLAIVVEAAHGRTSRPGSVYRLDLDDAELRRPFAAGLHGVGAAVEVARERDRLPGHLVAYAVEAGDLSAGQGLSAAVAATVGRLAARVEDEIVLHRTTAARDRTGEGGKDPSASRGS